MKSSLMAAASLLSLMIALPSWAADVSATDVSGIATANPDTSEPNNTLEKVNGSLQNVDNTMHDMAADVKAYFISKDKDAKLEPVLIHRNMMAHGLIGQSIINSSGEKIATLKDIIINKEGRAVLVIVSDSGVLGIGSKVAAFDYNKVIAQKSDGQVVMILSQEMVDHAADFSYDPNNYAKAKVIPTGSISVDLLLEGSVLNSRGAKVADIENIYFRNTDISQVIVGFNKKLGLGGDLAALDYNNLQMVKGNNRIDFKLTEKQSQLFSNFTKSVSN